MNTTSKLVLAAVLFSAVASPAFAGDQDLATLLATSGRYIPAQQTSAPAGAFASAGYVHHRAAATSHWSAEMAMIDRLAEGHN